MSNTTMRLDRFLELSGACKSRTDAKKVLHNHCVYVNDILCLKAESKVDPEQDVVLVNGTRYTYKEFRYFVLNKPEGVISATKDRISDTVLALIPEADSERYFPVGRLDKDTEGLLLITNDGALSHALLSPKKEIPKTYYFETDGELPDNASEALKQPIVFKEFTSKPAELMIKSKCSGEITVTEGKYHEVKRLIHTLGVDVTYLKRISFGPLSLGTLEKGEERPLTEAEIEALRDAVR